MLFLFSLSMGCFMKPATDVNPFEKSDQAMMSAVMEKASLSSDLEKWMKEAGDANIVLINMEDSQHTNDQLPEYLIVDHLYTKFKDGNSEISIIERDQNILDLYTFEREGVQVREVSIEDSGDSLTPEERREEIGSLIQDVVRGVSPQDVLIQLEESCCSANDEKSATATEILANEVGDNKSELLQYLVEEYTNLYPNVTSGGGKGIVETKEVITDMADYLVAYRVYDFGNWKSVQDDNVNRITYVKLHIRVVDMTTGEVIVSDFMENTIEDRLTSDDDTSLKRDSNAKQTDFGRPSRRSRK